MHAPGFQRAHYRLCGLALRILYRQAEWALNLTVEITGATPDLLPEASMLVLCRHAGPGDSFLLAHALINWYDRDPRIVLKDSLQWDPTIDVLLHRLPNRFIAPGGGTGVEAQIADLATDLDDNDALVIFPEGGNFTPERWQRGIERLRRLGLASMARRAERMRNVLPPRPGGVLAALVASPDATVVFVGHTGVDHLRTAADVWRELPMDKTISMQWWLESPENIPADPEQRIEWLYGWWARIDGWISDNRPEPRTRCEGSIFGWLLQLEVGADRGAVGRRVGADEIAEPVHDHQAAPVGLIWLRGTPPGQAVVDDAAVGDLEDHAPIVGPRGEATETATVHDGVADQFVDDQHGVGDVVDREAGRQRERGGEPAGLVGIVGEDHHRRGVAGSRGCGTLNVSAEASAPV